MIRIPPRSSAAIVCISLLLGAAPPAAAQDDSVRYAGAFALIDQYIAREMPNANTPGLSLALTTRDHLLRATAYGYANLDAKTPVTPATPFEIGSISKSFIAISLLQLRDEGKFDPGKPVSSYLPWFSVGTRFRPITGHDLLTHSSGLPRDRDDIPSSMYQAYGVRERTTGSAPGAHWAYSNIGYQILGQLLARIDGRPSAESVLWRILEPLEMTATEPLFTHDTRRRLAVGYTSLYDDRPARPSDPLVPGTWIEYAAGDGAIVSTPSDLAKYLRMILNRGRGPHGSLMSEESFDLFTQRTVQSNPGDSIPEFYGYGISIRSARGHTILHHSGGMIGYSTTMVGDLDDGLGVIVFINGPGNPAAVARFALGTLAAASHGDSLPPLPPPTEPSQVENAGDYAGGYFREDGRRLILTAEGGSLYLTAGDRRAPLVRHGRDAFLSSLPEFALFPLRFGRDSDRVVELWYGGDWYLNPRYRGPRQFSYPRRWNAYPGHYRIMQPWEPNFRVVLRKGRLWWIGADGGEEALTELSSGFFRLGGPLSAERLRFSDVVDGKALKADLSGMDYYRFFTP